MPCKKQGEMVLVIALENQCENQWTLEWKAIQWVQCMDAVQWLQYIGK